MFQSLVRQAATSLLLLSGTAVASGSGDCSALVEILSTPEKTKTEIRFEALPTTKFEGYCAKGIPAVGEKFTLEISRANCAARKKASHSVSDHAVDCAKVEVLLEALAKGDRVSVSARCGDSITVAGYSGGCGGWHLTNPRPTR